MDFFKVIHSTLYLDSKKRKSKKVPGLYCINAVYIYTDLSFSSTVLSNSTLVKKKVRKLISFPCILRSGRMFFEVCIGYSWALEGEKKGGRSRYRGSA
jgi:hypothetical protein